jgi:alpha-L-fucosidase 2
MHARGGFEVDLKWQDGKLVSATILSRNGNDCTIRYGDKVRELKISKGQRVDFFPQ